MAKLAEMVASGAVVVLGRVGEVAPPHLCLPIGIEPLKPRMIHDAQFLNLWCHADTFEFDGLHMVPTILGPGHHAWSLDHVSGYLHVNLTQRSRTFFGIKFDGIYYAWTVLSFGWLGSCLVYNTLSTEVADYLHRLGVPNLVYLDDALGGELVSVSPALFRTPGRLTDTQAPEGSASGRLIDLSYGRSPSGAWPGGTGLVAARAAAFVACSVWTALGYFLQVHVKSVLEPQRSLQWLGVLIDTGGVASPPSFRLLPAKRIKLAAQVLACLVGPSVAYKDLERLCGRCASLFLVIPGCLFLTRCMYAALAASRWRERAPVPLPPDSALFNELTLWRTVPDSPPRPWPEPTHAVLEIWDVIYKTSPQEGWSDSLMFEVEPHTLALHYRLTHPALPSDSTGGWLDISFDSVEPPLRELYRSGVPHHSVEFIHNVLRLALEGMPRAIGNCFLDVVVSAGFRPRTIFASDLCLAPVFAYWLFSYAARRNLLVTVLEAPGPPYAFDVTGLRPPGPCSFEAPGTASRRLNPRGAYDPSPRLPTPARLDRALSSWAFQSLALAFEGAGFPRFRIDLMGTPSRVLTFRSGIALPSLTRAGPFRFTRPPIRLRPGGSLGSQCLSRACSGVPLFVDPPSGMIGPLLAFLRLQRAGPVVVILPCDSRAYWFTLVAAVGVAATVVARAGSPLPYELFGYAPPAEQAAPASESLATGSGPAAPSGLGGPGPAPAGASTLPSGPAIGAQDSAAVHSDSALSDGPGYASPAGRRGQGSAHWLPVARPLPAPLHLPHDLLAVLFDFRVPRGWPATPASGLGPFSAIPPPPPRRGTRDFTYVYPVIRPHYI